MRGFLLTLFAVSACLSPSSAQTPRLVLDINRNAPPGQGSGPSPVSGTLRSFDDRSTFLQVGAHLWFSAEDSGGRELWATLGTASTTRRLFDLHPFGSSAPQQLTEIAPNVFVFVANTASTGSELFATDGSQQGTKLLKDIFRGVSSSRPLGLTRLGSGAAARVVFSASVNNDRELWVTDGTTAGTKLLKNIHPTFGSNPENFVRTKGGKVAFFVADDGVHGRELWRTDGTAAGTRLVKDLNPGVASSAPNSIIAFGSAVLFSAFEPSRGSELWRVDTATETVTLVRDFFAGPTSGVPLVGAAEFRGHVYFQAFDGTIGASIWRTDGTPRGTTLLVDANSRSLTGSFRHATVANGRLWFEARGPGQGAELWVTDGTQGGTRLVRDIEPGPGSSFPAHFAGLPNGDVVFSARTSANGAELWITDGTTAGTRLLIDLLPGAASSLPRHLTVQRGRVVFAATGPSIGNELFVTDGTASGTRLLKDIRVEPTASSLPSHACELDGVLYFQANDGQRGRELWRSDGTAAGTRLVADIVAGSPGSAPHGLVAVRNRIVFAARHPSFGDELWITDGTSTGTKLLIDLESGTAGSRPSILGVARDRVYFSAVTNGEQLLWSTDGTTRGTRAVYKATQVFGLFPRGFAEIPSSPGHFLFAAFDMAAGLELHVSDGTTAGTRALDVAAGRTGILPVGLEPHGARVWFSGTSTGQGSELWSSDGTVAGTRMFADLLPGASGSAPAHLCSAGELLFFAANTRGAGRELWVTDGTVAGTRFIDVKPGPESSLPGHITRIDRGRVAFVAADRTVGTEVWVSDGTPAGTKLIADIHRGGSSSPRMTAHGKARFARRRADLYFAANDGTTGWELFELPLGASAWMTRAGCGEFGKAPRLDATRPRLGRAQEIVTSLEGSRLGVLLLGAVARSPIGLGGGCDTIVDIRVPVVLDLWIQSRAGERRSRLPVPRDTSIVGAHYAVQAFTLSSLADELRVTNAIEAVVGH